MFHLAIIFTIALMNGDEEVIRTDYNYQFANEIGCYLAGRVELNTAGRSGQLNNLPYNAVVEISCTKI